MSVFWRYFYVSLFFYFVHFRFFFNFSPSFSFNISERIHRIFFISFVLENVEFYLLSCFISCLLFFSSPLRSINQSICLSVSSRSISAAWLIASCWRWSRVERGKYFCHGAHHFLQIFLWPSPPLPFYPLFSIFVSLTA